MAQALRSRLLYGLVFASLAAAAMAAGAAEDEEPSNPLADKWNQFRQAIMPKTAGANHQALNHDAGRKFTTSRPATTPSARPAQPKTEPSRSAQTRSAQAQSPQPKSLLPKPGLSRFVQSKPATSRRTPPAESLPEESTSTRDASIGARDPFASMVRGPAPPSRPATGNQPRPRAVAERPEPRSSQVVDSAGAAGSRSATAATSSRRGYQGKSQQVAAPESNHALAGGEPDSTAGLSLEERMQNWRKPAAVAEKTAQQPAVPEARIARSLDKPAAEDAFAPSAEHTSPLDVIEPPTAVPTAHKLRVESMGPRSIALNQPATYTVAVHNDSDIEARDVAVMVRVPAWAEIVSSRSNSPLARRIDKEAAGGLKWQVQRIAARSGMELTMQIVPRERKAFELAVDWTSAPSSSIASSSSASSRRRPIPSTGSTAAAPMTPAPAALPTPDLALEADTATAADIGPAAPLTITNEHAPLASSDAGSQPLPAAPLALEAPAAEPEPKPVFAPPALAEAPAKIAPPVAPHEAPSAPALPAATPPAPSGNVALEQTLPTEPTPAEPQVAAMPEPTLAPTPANEPTLAKPPAAATESIAEPRQLPSPLREQPDKNLPVINLAISGPEAVAFGEEAVFKLTLTNTGKADAEAVEVRLLPSGGGGQPIATHTIGVVRAGESQMAEIELIARDPGQLTIHAEAIAAGDHRFSAEKIVEVTSTELKVAIEGPQRESLGAVAAYRIHVSNHSQTPLADVKVTVSLPPDAGVASLSGADKRLSSSPERTVLMLNKLAAEEERVIELNCTFDQAGEHKLHATAEADKLRHTGTVATMVQGAPDLVLDIVPPKGQIPVRSVAKYEVWVRNRGTGPAEGLQVATFFSEGIEPISASGAGHQVGPGQVLFHRIPKINPGDELVLTVNAAAQDAGRHRFRAELHSKSPDITLAEEATARFGDTRPAVAEQPHRSGRTR